MLSKLARIVCMTLWFGLLAVPTFAVLGCSNDPILGSFVPEQPDETKDDTKEDPSEDN